VCPHGNFLVPEDSVAEFMQAVPVHPFGMFVGLLGVLKSPPGALLSGLVVLLPMGLRGAAMRMGGKIVQLRRPLVILVM
jgi:hypothetical protein